MPRAAKIVLVLAVTVALAALTAVAAGKARLRRQVTREVEELFARSAGVEPGVIEESDLEGLPEPVQRWLRHAGVVGKERPAAVRLRQTGEFRPGVDQPWMPFEAEEYYTTNPPGLVWIPKLKPNPLLTITGRDRYFEGRGNMQIKLMSLIPVVDMSGAEMDQGTLLRFLNEIVWFPAAALMPYITWEGIDANSARATMSYAGVSASADFFFDEQGNVTNMVAERYRTTDGGATLDTWATPMSDWGEFNGIRMPIAGEGLWKLDTGDFPYVRLRITDVEYDRPAMYER